MSSNLSAIKTANLALRFLLELCALVAFGYWGFSLGASPVAHIGLGLGIPLVVAVLWGTFLAPRAPRRLSRVGVLLVGTGVLLLSALALGVAGQTTLAVILAAVIVVNSALLWVGEQ